MNRDRDTILFTGFEPSGDDHAASVIRKLKADFPHLRICAWGGPNMEAAGAEIIEHTGRDAVMGLPGLKKIREHRRINRDVAHWLDRNADRVLLHVPVDSPAANFPICELAKKRGLKVVHLVAPQIWAWGRWRIAKLRRLTDFVCCLLPFEEPFFSQRGVPARFVGHPLFDHPVDYAEIDAAIVKWPRGEPAVAIMPGSRPAEIEKNFPLLLDTFRDLKARYPGLRGRIAATTPEVADRLRQIAGAAGRAQPEPWPEHLDIVVRATDAVVRWCDLALVVSGTVTLQLTRQHKPMVIVYRSPSPFVWHAVARWLVRTDVFSLPNLVAGRRFIPELIPHFGGHAPIAAQAAELIEHPELAAAQAEQLRRVTECFSGRHAAREAAAALANVAGLARTEPAEFARADTA